MKEIIINGDALSTLKTLPDQSVDCCVTSPPYYKLRDYGVDGQIGLENTVREYIDNLTAVFMEVYRVLKNNGTLWLNMGDCYSGSKKGRNADGHSIKENPNRKNMTEKIGGIIPIAADFKRKDLIGISWLLALSLQSEGWYLRQDVIWYKPNCMPESVKDRCTRSHEYIFLLSKSPKYYFDYEGIKEPAVGFDKSSPRGSKGTLTPNSGRRKGNNKSFRGSGVYTNNRSYDNSANKEKLTIGNTTNDTGLRNRRDVWSISSKGYKGMHFATFPPDLAKNCIIAGCPDGGVVLDPFFGSGTVGVVAKANHRGFIGIELNPEYIDLAKSRIMAYKNLLRA